MSKSDRHLQMETAAVKAMRSLLLEITDDPQTIADTVEGECSIELAIHGVLKDMMDDDILLCGIEATIAGLTERKKRLERRQEKRELAIQTAIELAEITKPLVYPEATVSLRRVPPALVIEDIAKIPAQFFDPQPPTLSKSRLKEQLKNGTQINGCHLGNGSSTISIRRS